MNGEHDTVTPTARTLAALRRAGFIACTVEKWITPPGIRKDCFGFADILAARPVDRRIVLIQATSAGNVSARIAKIKSKNEAEVWLKSNGEIEVWGWCKRVNRWRVKIVALRAEDMAAVMIVKPARKPRGNWHSPDLFRV
jgi:hypothetical protein